MTGDFPPARPGSNAIGTFVIGVSPIGTPGFPWQDTVISQYANSPSLLGLVRSFAVAVDQAEDFDSFYDFVWNVKTAQGEGLDVWGRIVGIGRTLTVDTGSYLGFEEADDATEVGFGQEPFYLGPPATDNFRLSDDAYRQLIFAKAAANICDGSISAINRLLMALFPGRGNAFVEDGFGIEGSYFGFEESGEDQVEGFGQEAYYSGQPIAEMNMRYIFNFALTAVELAIVQTSGVLPTPTGVSAAVVVNA